MKETRKSRYHKIDISMGEIYKNSPVKGNNSRLNYTNFIKAYYREIRRLMIEENYVYKFTHRLGNIKIYKYLPYSQREPLLEGELNKTGLKVDYPSTKKMWKEKPDLAGKKFVYYTNEHSEGYKYLIYWDKRMLNFKNQSAVSFKPCRDFNTQLGKAILSGYDYFLKPC